MKMKERILKLNHAGEDVKELHTALVLIGFLVPIAELKRKRFGRGTEAVVIEFQTSCGIEPTGEVDRPTAAAIRNAAATNTFTVTGVVASPDSASVGGLSVELVDKNVGEDVPLGAATTDNQGNYRITAVISPASLKKQHKTKPDLQARVSAGKTFLAASQVQYNSSNNVTLNVTLPAGSTALPSEYETLTATLKLNYTGQLGDLQETATRQDITFLANKTGWDARAVAMAALADQFNRNQPAAQTASTVKPVPASGGIHPAFYYALFRAGLAPNVNTLYQISPQKAAAIWKQAIAQQVIPSSLGSEIDAATQAFQALSAGNVLTAPPQIGISPLQDLLHQRFTDPKTQQQQSQQFASLYTQYQDDLPTFWNAVQKAFGPTLTKQLQVDGQLAYLTVNNAPLLKRLYATQPQNSIGSIQDLVSLGYYQAANWQPLVQNDIPSQIPGATPDQQRANYAELLAAQVRLSFPTAVVADMVVRNTIAIPGDTSGAVRKEVASFLNANQGQFEVGSEPVERFLARNNLAGTVSAPALAQVKRLQRVYQITPNDQAFTALLQSNLDSAFAITRHSAPAFIRSFGQAMGGEQTATQVYNQAQTVFNATLNVVTSYLTASRAFALGSNKNGLVLDPRPNRLIPQPPPPLPIGPEPVPGAPAPTASPIIASATLEGLFGSMDFCACDDCRSILSPAAYLVDLLRFINCQTPQKENPQDVLFSRRPDIPYLPLTCDNTNIALPYIDLVNETLEYCVANHLSLADYHGHNTDDSLTSEELLASPQFVNDAAYSTLQNTYFPPPLPFHRPLELLRQHFQKIGVKLQDAMEALRGSDAIERGGNNAYGWRDILMEQLNLSRDEYKILTDASNLTDPSFLTLQQLYGYPSTLATADCISALSSFKDLSRRTAVSYDDLISIVKTQFINPNANLISRLEALNVSFATIAALQPGPNQITAAAFIALLPPGLDPSEYGAPVGAPTDDYQPIVDWLTDGTNYSKIMSLITVANPTVGSITLDGVFAAQKTTTGEIADLQWTWTTDNNGNETLTQAALTLVTAINKAAAAAMVATPNADVYYQAFAVSEVVYITPIIPAGQPASNLTSSTFTAANAGTILLTTELIDNTDLCTPANLWFRYSNPDNTKTLLTEADFVRLLRFIRLWQKLGLTIEQIDDIITALYPSAYPFTGNLATDLPNLDKGFSVMLPRIGFLFQVMDRLKLTPAKDLMNLLACWAPIGTVGDNSLYRKMFLTPALLQEDPGAQTATVAAGINAGDVLNTTINGITISYTVPASPNNTAVASAIAVLINNNTTTEPVTGLPLNQIVFASSAAEVITIRAALFKLACMVSASAQATYLPPNQKPAISQTVNVGGTIKLGDVLTTTINGVAIPYTVAANDTTLTALASHIAAAINGTATQDPVSGLPLNRLLVASNAGSVLTVTAVGCGMPFALACSLQTGSYAAAGPFPASQTMSVAAPITTGDVITTTINGVNIPYTVVAADTTPAILASNIAAAINTTNTQDNANDPPLSCVVSASSLGGIITITAINPAATFTLASSKSPGASETVTLGPLVPPKQTATVVGPFTAGNVLTTTINGVAVAYTVIASDTSTVDVVGTIAANIAALVNATSDVDQFTNLPLNQVVKASTTASTITIQITAAATTFTLGCSQTTGDYVAGRQLPTFADDGYGNFLKDASQTLFGHEPILRAAFNLTGAEFALIVEALGFDAATPLTLENISSIYRRGWLARVLHLSVVEFLLLTKFAGLDPFAPIDPLLTAPAEPPVIRLIRLAKALQTASLRPVQALYLLWNQDISGTSAPSDAIVANLARTLRTDFAMVDSQFTLKDDPNGDIANALMALVYEQAATDYFFGLLNNTFSTSVTYSNPQPSLAQPILDAASGRLGYDDYRKQLTYTGVLDLATLNNLNAAINANGASQPLLGAVSVLFNRNQQAVGPFFVQYPELLPLYTSYATSSDTLDNRRKTLLKNFLPYLIARRKSEQALTDATAAAGADPTFAPALLDNVNVLKAATATAAPVVNDLTAIGSAGLSVEYFLTNDLTATPDLTADTVAVLSYTPTVTDASQTATINGTVSPGDVLAVTINGVVITYTAVLNDNSVAVAAGFVTNINKTTTPDPVSGLPLNQVVVASSSGNVLTIDALNPAASFVLASSLSPGTYTVASPSQTSQTATLAGSFSPGDVLTTTINGVPIPYTVAPGDTLAGIANNILSAINGTLTPDPATGLPLNRIVLASIAAGVIRINSVTAGVAFTLAGSLTPAPAGAYTCAGPFPAWQTFTVGGTITAGDTLDLKINGVPVNCPAIAGSDTPATIAASIATAINTTTTIDNVSGLPLNLLVLASSNGPAVTIKAINPTTLLTVTCVPGTGAETYTPGSPNPPSRTATVTGAFPVASMLTTLINNAPVVCTVGQGDSAATIANNIATAINNSNPVNQTVKAASAAGVVTITALQPATPFALGCSVSEATLTAGGPLQTTEVVGVATTNHVLTTTFNGTAVNCNVGSGDTATKIAGNIAAKINGTQTVDPVTGLPINQLVYASSVAGVVILTALNPASNFTLSCLAPANAGETYALGNTSPALQVLTVAGTFTPGNRLTATINSVATSYTVTAADTSAPNVPAAIAANLVLAINQQAAVDPISNLALNKIFLASNSGGIIIIKAAGATFSLSCAVQAGAGEIFAAAGQLPARQGGGAVAGIWTGYIGAPADGDYDLGIVADSTANVVLEIDDASVPLMQNGTLWSNQGVISLAAGALSKIKIAATGLTSTFIVNWRSTGLALQVIPGAYLYSDTLMDHLRTSYVRFLRAVSLATALKLTADEIAYLAGSSQSNIPGCAGKFAPGTNVFTPSSMSSIKVGSVLVMDAGAAQETVTVSAVTPTTFMATTAKAHDGTVVPFPIVSAATTDSTDNFAAGKNIFTPNSMAGINVGSVLVIDIGAAQETITVTAVTQTTFTAVTINSHNGTVSPFPIYSPSRTDGTDKFAPGSSSFTPASMAGIRTGSWLVLDAGAAQEVVRVTAITDTTFTATTVNAHDGTNTPFPTTVIGQGWLNSLPVTGDPDGPTASGLRDVLVGILAFARIKAALSPKDERLLNALQDPSALLPNNTDALLTLTGWNPDSLNALLSRVFKTTKRDNLTNIVSFRRVYDAYAIVTSFGISAGVLIAAATNNPSAQTVSTLQSALRARYAKADWLTVIKPINDTIRDKQRDALVAYVLQQLGDNPATSDINTADKLFEYFLMDVQMEPIMETSRIRHALSSVQLFIERCLRNLEPDVAGTDLSAADWEWMKRYRVWEANREVFLWPENWLYPELRTDQSQFFKDSMSELLQSDITDDTAAVAYQNYLTKLEEVAKLEPCGMFYQPSDPGSSVNPGEITHVVARTAGAHRKYYYRRLESGAWTPWEEIKLPIEDNPVTPFVWNNRLLLFWLRILKQTPTDPSQSENQSAPANDVTFSNSTKLSEVKNASMTSAAQAGSPITVQAVLCWSEYHNGKWQPTKTSDMNRPTTIGAFQPSGSNQFDRSHYQIKVASYSFPPNILVVSISQSGERFQSQAPGFLLYNTHSAPTALEDVAANPNWGSTPWRSLLTRFGSGGEIDPNVAYPPNASPNTFSVFYTQIIAIPFPHSAPAYSNDLFTSPLGQRVVVSQTQPARDDAWSAPFFYEDSRNAFYVTTGQALVPIWSHLGYGSFNKETSPDVTAVQIPPLVQRQIPLIPDPVGPVVSANNPPTSNPAEMQTFVSEDANIRTAINTLVAVPYGGQTIGPTGRLAGGQISQE
jgi:Neuraminidase-like domain/Putative peptidoglycan binding domain/Salmonella virulence plasmid 28.1kDa A protein